MILRQRLRSVEKLDREHVPRRIIAHKLRHHPGERRQRRLGVRKPIAIRLALQGGDGLGLHALNLLHKQTRMFAADYLEVTISPAVINHQEVAVDNRLEADIAPFNEVVHDPFGGQHTSVVSGRFSIFLTQVTAGAARRRTAFVEAVLLIEWKVETRGLASDIPRHRWGSSVCQELDREPPMRLGNSASLGFFGKAAQSSSGSSGFLASGKEPRQWLGS